VTVILKQKTWVLFVTAVPKPRMTKRDSWAKRPCVIKYWAFKAALLREFDGQPYPADPHIVSANFYLPIPKSWSKRKRRFMDEKMHRQKPDVDNYVKAVFDCLFADDSRIAGGCFYKYWTIEEPRIEITMTWEEEE
jgi:Holliday junction resolvase RusA-like endonuclease